MQILLVFNNNQTDRDGHALKVPSDGPAGPRLGWPLPMGNHRMLYLSHKVVLDIVARQPGFIAIVQPRDHPLTSLELQVQRKEEAARSSAPTPGASLPLYTKTDGLLYQAAAWHGSATPMQRSSCHGKYHFQHSSPSTWHFWSALSTRFLQKKEIHSILL